MLFCFDEIMPLQIDDVQWNIEAVWMNIHIDFESFMDDDKEHASIL